jgi:hypothetical protein
MPKNEWNKDRVRKNKYRKINYERGRFGSRRRLSVHKFDAFQSIMIWSKIWSDRKLAEMFGSSVNGIQSKRWRMKNGY